MRKINVGNDYAFREQLRAGTLKVEKQNEKQYDNNSTARTEAAGPIEQPEQTDTQEVSKEKAEEKKKGKAKSEKK